MIFGGPDPDPKGSHQLWWSTAAALTGSVSVIAVILVLTRDHVEWHPDRFRHGRGDNSTNSTDEGRGKFDTSDIVLVVIAGVCGLLAFTYASFKLWKGPPPSKAERYRHTTEFNDDNDTAANAVNTINAVSTKEAPPTTNHIKVTVNEAQQPAALNPLTGTTGPTFTS